VEKAAGLLKEAGESKEDKIRSASRYLLACTYLQMDKSKEAQDILEAMPAEEVDPKKMLPTVYLQRGEFDKAMKLNQQNLFEGVQSAAMALTGLASIAMRQKKWDDALRYADAQRKLIEAFGLDDFMMSSNCQLYLLIYSRRKDAERTLKYLKQYVSVFPYDVSTLRLSDNFFFSMAETKEPSVMLNFTKETVVRELKQNKDFDFLRGDARFQSLLESFQN
jgi:tetratricopeptide (TPR) repeat protein